MLILLTSQYFYFRDNEDLIHKFILGSIYIFVNLLCLKHSDFIYLCQPHSIFIPEIMRIVFINLSEDRSMSY